jgi:dihydroflavonol-4-reductase
MNRRILVTGATGFAGSHLTRALVAEAAVRALVRSRERAAGRLPAEVELVEGDITDRESVDRAVRGCQIVYHLAAAYREAGLPRRRYREVHVTGTEYLLDAALRAGVQRFVHCSTVGVHGHVADPPADETWPHRPGDIYQATKSEGERLALAFGARYGLPVAVARPTAIYGPGDLRLLKLFRLIARRRFVMLGSGEVYYHMVYVDDLVAGFRLLAERPEAVGEVFILGGAEYRTLNELVRLIADTLGVPPPRWRLPVWPVRWVATLCEGLAVPLGVEPPLYRRRVDFFVKSRAFSIDKARRRLGYEPTVNLRTGLRRTADWYRTHGYL